MAIYPAYLITYLILMRKKREIIGATGDLVSLSGIMKL